MLALFGLLFQPLFIQGEILQRSVPLLSGFRVQGATKTALDRRLDIASVHYQWEGRRWTGIQLAYLNKEK